MMDMVERVARALAADIERVGPARTRMEWDDLTTLAKATMMVRARAAIEAMREPTEVMVLTQGKSHPENAKTERTREAAELLNHAVRRNAVEVWHEMIDAALTPSPAAK